MIKMKRFNTRIAVLLLMQFALLHLNISAQEGLTLLGNRFFTFSTVVRVNQIETSRDAFHGTDESSIHTPEGARKFRETIENSLARCADYMVFQLACTKRSAAELCGVKKTGCLLS